MKKAAPEGLDLPLVLRKRSSGGDRAGPPAGPWTISSAASRRGGMPGGPVERHAPEPSPCISCGACCAYSDTWPEFGDEDDLDGIPESMCDCNAGRMRCERDRCVALEGEIGRDVRCSVYEGRPAVCRDFEPCTPACNTVRRHFGLAGLIQLDAARVDEIAPR